LVYSDGQYRTCQHNTSAVSRSLVEERPTRYPEETNPSPSTLATLNTTYSIASVTDIISQSTQHIEIILDPDLLETQSKIPESLLKTVPYKHLDSVLSKSPKRSHTQKTRPKKVRTKLTDVSYATPEPKKKKQQKVTRYITN